MCKPVSGLPSMPTFIVRRGALRTTHARLRARCVLQRSFCLRLEGKQEPPPAPKGTTENEEDVAARLERAKQSVLQSIYRQKEHFEETRAYEKLTLAREFIQHWRRGIMIGAGICTLAALVYFLFHDRLISATSKSASAVTRGTLRDDDVQLQVEELSKQIVARLLRHQPTVDVTSDFAESLVAHVMNQPSTVEHGRDLVAKVLALQAVEDNITDLATKITHHILRQPSTVEKVSLLMIDVLNNEDVQRYLGTAINRSAKYAFLPSFLSKHQHNSSSPSSPSSSAAGGHNTSTPPASHGAAAASAARLNSDPHSTRTQQAIVEVDDDAGFEELENFEEEYAGRRVPTPASVAAAEPLAEAAISPPLPEGIGGPADAVVDPRGAAVAAAEAAGGSGGGVSIPFGDGEPLASDHQHPQVVPLGEGAAAVFDVNQGRDASGRGSTVEASSVA